MSVAPLQPQLADHSVYLKAEKSLLVDGNKTGQNTKLLGGDANDDMTVDTLDLDLYRRPVWCDRIVHLHHRADDTGRE